MIKNILTTIYNIVMKKIISFYLSFILVITLALAYQGCSELEDNLVTTGTPGFHGAGWLKPSSENFHGSVIASAKWRFDGCKTCHGTDYRGGNTGTTCYKCHKQGPEHCNVCHGSANYSNPPEALNGDTSATSPRVGAHVKHLDTSGVRITAVVACSECHRQVTAFADSNHIGPDPDNIAEINFGPLARKTTQGVTPNPEWNRTTLTCSSVYCHGTFEGGNVNNTAIWTVPGSASCGTCHGNPQTGNPNPPINHNPNNTINDCANCHPIVINAQGVIIGPEKHVNGIVNFGQ
jgi:predicted CxxxxCH...CXXCH cytochrome family protein